MYGWFSKSSSSRHSTRSPKSIAELHKCKHSQSHELEEKKAASISTHSSFGVVVFNPHVWNIHCIWIEHLQSTIVKHHEMEQKNSPSRYQNIHIQVFNPHVSNERRDQPMFSLVFTTKDYFEPRKNQVKFFGHFFYITLQGGAQPSFLISIEIFIENTLKNLNHYFRKHLGLISHPCYELIELV